jgi:flagellar assembly protein FliH
MKASSSNVIPGEALTDADWSSWQVGELSGLSQKSSTSASERLASRVESVPEEAAPAPKPEVKEEPPLSYPTAAELEAIHQEAWQAGFEAGKVEGFQQGQAEGQEQGKAEVVAQFNSVWQPLEGLAEAFAGELACFETELSEYILKVAFELAQKLAVAQITLDRDAIRSVLMEAMAEWPEDLARARVRVNPGDLTVVRAMLEADAPQTVWQWIEDPNIERGGCIIDTKAVSLDLTLERRREALAVALGLAPHEVDDTGLDDA